MSNFTADFRRFHSSSSFSRRQLELIERLERQRHTLGRVRAVVDDPEDIFPPVLTAYIAYIRHLTPGRDSFLITPTWRRHVPVSPSAPIKKSTHTATPRSYLRIYGIRRPIGQILLLHTHAYCPSIPLYRSRLDAILQVALPYIGGPNSVVIIHGSSKTARNTRFRHWLNIAHTPTSIYHLPLAPKSKHTTTTPKKIIFTPLRVCNPQPLCSGSPILHTYPAKIAA